VTSAACAVPPGAAGYVCRRAAASSGLGDVLPAAPGALRARRTIADGIAGRGLDQQVRSSHQSGLTGSKIGLVYIDTFRLPSEEGENNVC